MTNSSINTEKAAELFMLQSVCEFGQPLEERIEGVQQLLDAAGFYAKATCFPIFGGIWKSDCEGKDAEIATKWLQDLTDNLQRGKFQHEVEQIKIKIEERRSA